MVSPLFVPETKEHDSCFTFISVGNLVKSKRFDLTLRAFSKSFQGDTRVRLKIVGDGIERSSLKEMALDLGIDGQVVFTGRLSRAEVLKQLQESDAFVLPSDFETFGVAYIEALACGLPVIGTHNGGADEIINDGCGYLVDTGDDTQLAEAMLRLYREYQYYDKVRLANDCQARFGEEIVCERIIDVYNGYKD